MNEASVLQRTDRPLTGPFWVAIDNHQLVRPVCDLCDRSHFSPQVVCPWCQSSSWTYQPSTGLGTIYSYTVVHRAPEPGFNAPYVVADIEMQEGWRLFSWIRRCDPREVVIGMTVTVGFDVGPDGQLLPIFEPKSPVSTAAVSDADAS